MRRPGKPCLSIGLMVLVVAIFGAPLPSASAIAGLVPGLKGYLFTFSGHGSQSWSGTYTDPQCGAYNGTEQLAWSLADTPMKGMGGAATTELTGREAFSRVTSKPGKGSITSTVDLSAPPASEACKEPGMSIGPCTNTADDSITWEFSLGVEFPPGHLDGSGLSSAPSSLPCELLGSSLVLYFSGPAVAASGKLPREYCDEDLTKCDLPARKDSAPPTGVMRIADGTPSPCQPYLISLAQDGGGCAGFDLFKNQTGTWQSTGDTSQLAIDFCRSRLFGKGYRELSVEFRERLGRMYAILADEGACPWFTVGYRSYDEQKRLYTKWHDIADKPYADGETPVEICEKLAEADLAQLPHGLTGSTKECDAVTGKIEYKGNVAGGGPAMPGESRHESAQAADISVVFAPEDGSEEYASNLYRYRTAAHAADLCGPPVSDRVHVEMPYKKGKEKEVKCHFG
jgi:hypothetical protein